MRSTILILVYAGLCACTPQPAVVAGGEKLLGERIAGPDVSVFRGVPFAEPPVGDLRWRPPQPLRTRLQARDATAFAPACMQSMRILEWYRDLAETFGASRDVMDDLVISEDCLHLNIWTPDLREDTALPVMVYLHGGSNRSGWSYEPNYHGHVLAARGVVLVSIAYRLGVFGFLSHPDLDDERGVANFGLLDQIAALEWIQENIADFGGDPGRVTVFGESAGAQNILALMASRRAAGLFHGAIMQSTAGFGISRSDSPTLDDERKRGAETAVLFGFAGPGTLASLRAIAADDLLNRYEEEFSGYYHSPAVDGYLLDKPVWDAIRDDELADIPFIIGTNADEWYASAPVDATEQDVIDAAQSSANLKSPAALEAVRGESDHREAIDRITTADGMLCPSQRMAASHSARLDNAWMYFFSRVRDGDAGAAVRAYHGAELPYVFGTHDPWMTMTETDRALSEQMIAYWISFAADGDPNRQGLPEWPVFGSQAGQVMQFADSAMVAPVPESKLCQLFRKPLQ